MLRVGQGEGKRKRGEGDERGRRGEEERKEGRRGEEGEEERDRREKRRGAAVGVCTNVGHYSLLHCLLSELLLRAGGSQLPTISLHQCFLLFRSISTTDVISH